MEKISCKYQPLFSVEVWHDYFLPFSSVNNPYTVLNKIPNDYSLFDFITIRPTDETMEFLKNHKCLIKKNKTGFAVYTMAIRNTGGNYYTTIPIDTSKKFCFEIHQKRGSFFNISSLPFIDSHVMFFSNLSNNKTDDGLYLSKPLKDFDTANSYTLGRLVRNSSKDKVCESIADSSNTGDLGDNLKWKTTSYRNEGSTIEVKGVSPVTMDDLIDYVESNWNFEAVNSSPGSVSNFVLKDIFGNDIALGNITGTNIPQNSKTTPPAGNSTWSHQISLTHVQPGRYRLEIDNPSTSEEFYFLNKRKEEGLIGIIELFNKPLSPDFGFVTQDANGTKIEEKKFRIRFKNRITKWSYYNNGDTNGSADLEIFNPLSRNYIKTDNPINLPNPNIDKIYPQKKTGTSELEAVRSEIFLYDKTI